MHSEQEAVEFAPGLAAALRDALEPLADEVIEAIGAEVPEYRRPMEGSFGRGLRTGVREALRQFVDMLGAPADGPLPEREVYRELGRGELRAGRRLDALQAAYRVGARISWRRLSAVARAQGAETIVVSALAEAMFAHIERISASSVEGYAQAQAQLAGERERLRRALVERLAGGEPIDRIALGALVERAEWPLPGRLAALACDGIQGASLAGSIGVEAIAGRIEGVTCVLVPDPEGPGRRGAIERALERAGAQGALGPAGSPWEAALSFARARAALGLRQRGLLGGAGRREGVGRREGAARQGQAEDGPLTMASERMLELILHADSRLAAELAQTRLGVLPPADSQAGERLLTTLRSWLDHGGSVAEVAAELHVHRQTVRYRLGRLRELIGEAMDDPRGRLELDLALRVRAAAGS